MRSTYKPIVARDIEGDELEISVISRAGLVGLRIGETDYVLTASDAGELGETVLHLVLAHYARIVR